MLGITGRPESTDGKTLEPLEAYGVQAMSIGFMIDADTPMVWRGPMVTQALEQLLKDTRWREVDFLVVDMPPGTGDIQLTLAQKVPVTGAVIVTTPQDIALIDARKGLKMFEKVGVPIVGVVENMSIHVCSNCGHVEHIFGQGGAQKMCRDYNVPFLGCAPARHPHSRAGRLGAADRGRRSGRQGGAHLPRHRAQGRDLGRREGGGLLGEVPGHQDPEYVSVTARALALGCAAAIATAAHALPDDAAVKALLDQRIAQKRAVGLAAVLYEKGTTRIVTAGMARTDGPSIAADTEFEIGSLTKTFTALLLAEDVVRGRAALDDPVTKYVQAPGLARDGRTVTLGQLATHSSGLPRLPKNLAPANPADPYADYDAAKLAAYIAGDVLQRTPGAAYEYSNLGAGLLGYALTSKDGGYEKVLRERVLVPLRMNDTTVTLSTTQLARFATGHDIQLLPVAPWRLDALAGAGALRSTPADMAKYVQAAVDPAESALAAAWRLVETPIADGPAPSLRMALAWHVATRDGKSVVWHNGQTGGFASMMAFDPLERVGVVVMSNTAIGVDDLALHMLDASIPLSESPRQRIAVKLDRESLDRVAGRYELARDFFLTIRRDGDRAYAQATGQPEAEVFAESDNEFFYKVVDAQLTFVRGQDGRVTGLVLHQGGRDIKARRIE